MTRRHARYAPHGIPVTTCRNLQCDRRHAAHGLCHAHMKRVLAGKPIGPAIGELEPRRSTASKTDRMPGWIAEIDAVLAAGGDLAAWADRPAVDLEAIARGAERLGRGDVARLCARLARRAGTYETEAAA